MRLLHDFLTEEEATEIMRVAEPRFSRSPVRLTGLEPQPSRLQMDLPLTRASSALDRLADMTEDVCKEYRGCCIGMRFLHPVWFIDEVELADCDYTRRTTVNGAEKLLP